MGENYNDGKWYGWNGGECPVHEMSLINFIYESGDKDDEFPAKDLNWNVNFGAFRVVKEHREPREWWITMCGGYTHAHTSLSAADMYCEHNSDVTTIHVREVL